MDSDVVTGSHFSSRSMSRCSKQEYSTAKRPKSTPANRHRIIYSADQTRNMRRPKTATLVGLECDRLNQVERESVRQHKFKTQFPARKEKPAPWQAQLEGEQKPIHIAPGYMLSRSKSKYQMTINDKLFELEQDRTERENKKKQNDPELNQLVATLKEQVADLQVYLEEERLKHNESKKKAADYLQDKVDELKTDHKEALRRLTDEHNMLLEQTTSEHDQEMADMKESCDALIARYKTEADFLQGAFESYKSQSNAESQQRLKEQKTKLKEQQEQELHNQLQELASRLKKEHSSAMIHKEREHNKAVLNLEKQNQKELDALNRRFTNHAADIRKLKDAEQKNKELQQKYEDLEKKYQVCEKELSNSKRENEELRVKVSVFETHFEEKVADVDYKYKSQISDVMEQNTQLRKQYRKKCEEFYALAARVDDEKLKELESSKDMMKALIQTRSKASISIAANHPNVKKTTPKSRPSSAPSTKDEEMKALESAGETEEYTARREAPFVRPQSVLEMSTVFEINELANLSEEELGEGLK